MLNACVGLTMMRARHLKGPFISVLGHGGLIQRCNAGNRASMTLQRVCSTSGGSARGLSTSSTTDTNFFRVSSLEAESDFQMAPNQKVVGSVVDNAVDLRKVRPGEVIEVPYEMTVASSFRDFWQSAFYSHDRINTSTPFARSMGLQDQTIPFSLMLFLAGSMSHADGAKIQTGFSRGRYHWPAFAGDSFKKKFVIQGLRNASD